MGAHRRLVCLVLGTLLAAGGASAADPTTVLIVRHAEKASDRDGSAAQRTRARPGRRRWRTWRARRASRAIFHTQFKRTLETVEPLAAQLEPVADRAPGRGHAGSSSSTIRTSWSGKTVLVAGHSNTVPEIVKALTGVAMEDIPDTQFDNLYVVVLPTDGPAEPDPPQVRRAHTLAARLIEERS